MNEQLLEQQSEDTLSFTAEISDEALEAAAGNGMGGGPYTVPGGPYGGPYCHPTRAFLRC